MDDVRVCEYAMFDCENIGGGCVECSCGECYSPSFVARPCHSTSITCVTCDSHNSDICKKFFMRFLDV